MFEVAYSSIQWWMSIRVKSMQSDSISCSSFFFVHMEMNQGTLVTDIYIVHIMTWAWFHYVVYMVLLSVVSKVSLSTLSITQLNRSGDRTQPCLTPLTTWNSSDVPSAVLTRHQVSVYISWMMSVRW